MKEKMKYQPEDIEALLAEKSFFELYEEEKKFVLEHLASPKEYERMRETLLSIRGGVGGNRSELHPGAHVRERLMKEFEQKKRRGAIIWWNGLLIGARDTFRFDLPAVRYGFAVLVLVIGSVIWFRYNGNSNKGKMEMAQHTKIVAPVSEPQKNIVAVPVDTQKNVKDEPVSKLPKKTITPSYPQVVVQQDQGMQHDLNFTDTAAVPDHFSDSLPANNSAVVTNTFNADGVDSGAVASSVLTTNSTSGVTYNWAPNAVTGNVNNLTSATYTVVVTDANGSSAVNATAVCSGTTSTVTAVGGTNGYTYSWSNANGTVIPQSRSLGQDVNAIKLFFELK